MIFKKQAEEDFNIQTAEFPEMEALINRCANIYRGVPEWLDDKDNIKTINSRKLSAQRQHGSQRWQSASRSAVPQGLHGFRNRLTRYIFRYVTG